MNRILNRLLVFSFPVALILCSGNILNAENFYILEVPAHPEEGFHFPYMLRVPETIPSGKASFLVVEGNNTGRSSDDASVHLESVRRAMTGRSIGRVIAEELGMPFLMPVFPRPKSDSHTYTHALDRDTILIDDGPLQRLDRQLLAMVADARSRLEARGWTTGETFAMAGFSASASFANRFSLLHPGRVKWVVAGGLNGILTLPFPEIEGESLPFPIGVGDFEQITGRAFDLETWQQIPQLLFMGALDTNDAGVYDDAYSQEERRLIFAILGKEMLPARWEASQRLYRRAGADSRFRTFEHLGHALDPASIREILAFVEEVSRPVKELSGENHCP